MSKPSVGKKGKSTVRGLTMVGHGLNLHFSRHITLLRVMFKNGLNLNEAKMYTYIDRVYHLAMIDKLEEPKRMNFIGHEARNRYYQDQFPHNDYTHSDVKEVEALFERIYAGYIKDMELGESAEPSVAQAAAS